MSDNDKSYDQMFREALIPHLARAIRENNGGSPAGDLICRKCGGEGGCKNRQRTAYPDEEDNWDVLCPKCQEEADEYWDEMWNEAYDYA